MSVDTIALIICAVAVLMAMVLVRSFARNEAKLRAESEAHWQQVASAIREKNPDADMSWCFSGNRPPFRNPTGPSPDSFARSPNPPNPPRINTGD